jgi:hypothetical protein
VARSDFAIHRRTCRGSGAVGRIGDVLLAEDLTQVRTRYGPVVMASPRNLTMSVLSPGGATNIAAG